jgi:hypothetical protein
MPTLVDSIALVELGDALWRVTRPDGDVLGYVESFEASGGTRYRAKRHLTSQRRFVPIGEFWVMSEAVDCFR